jgi:hypothetical protein
MQVLLIQPENPGHFKVSHQCRKMLSVSDGPKLKDLMNACSGLMISIGESYQTNLLVCSINA